MPHLHLLDSCLENNSKVSLQIEQKLGDRLMRQDHDLSTPSTASSYNCMFKLCPSTYIQGLTVATLDGDLFTRR